MKSSWSDWKRFPHAARGEQLEAPIGSGLYEVRKVTNGELFAFGAAQSVANALSDLTFKKPFLFGLISFPRRDNGPLPDLEYRTWATASLNDARSAAASMLGRRETFVRRAA